jgi:hypothetical protein
MLVSCRVVSILEAGSRSFFSESERQWRACDERKGEVERTAIFERYGLVQVWLTTVAETEHM